MDKWGKGIIAGNEKENLLSSVRILIMGNNGQLRVGKEFIQSYLIKTMFTV